MFPTNPSPPPPRAPGTTVIGVLGGIASGKSLVARLLAGSGEGEGVVIDADRLAREALEEPAIAAALRERWGEAASLPSGRPDREAIAARVFEDPAERRWLEARIHPWVRERIREAIERARARGAARVVLDVPLLLENDAAHGLARACDALVFVEAGEAEREERAMAARGWSRGELARRERAQVPLAEKRARADFVLPNHGDVRELEEAVRGLLDSLART